MATVVKIQRNVGMSNQLVSAIQMLQGGLQVLYGANGVRAQMIATGPALMKEAFGLTTDADAQTVSDRWAAIVAGMVDPAHEDYAKYQKIRDFIDAVIII